MTQSQIEALLGRPLTTVEVTNLQLYLDIANDRLEELLCTSITAGTGERVYEVREDYSTVFTDIFTSLVSVKADGQPIDPSNYSVRQWDKRNGKWYNSIVFDTKFYRNSTITVDAIWGFTPTGTPAVSTVPADLKLLTAQLFSLVSSMNTSNSMVKSKKVEDFAITFSDNTVYDQFLLDNQSVVSKYSLCGITNVRSGEIEHWRY